MARIRAYFKVDLYFFEHPKVVDLSSDAIVLFLASIAYCNRRETDGFVPSPVLRRLMDFKPHDDGYGSIDDVAHELVKAELWELVEGGWQVHDFLDNNESREEREDRRTEDAARKRRARAETKERPDRPDPPSGGTSGGVRSDKSGRPDGQKHPSEPVRPIEVEVTEHRSNREEVPPTAGRVATAATITPIPTAQTFVAAYVDAYRGRAGHDPPSRVKGHLAKELGRLIADGIPPETIKAGFVEWFDADQHPSTLASFVESRARGGQPKARTRQQHGRAQLIETDQALGQWAEQRRQERERGDNDGRGTMAGAGQEAQWQLPRPGTTP